MSETIRCPFGHGGGAVIVQCQICLIEINVPVRQVVIICFCGGPGWDESDGDGR